MKRFGNKYAFDLCLHDKTLIKIEIKTIRCETVKYIGLLHDSPTVSYNWHSEQEVVKNGLI